MGSYAACTRLEKETQILASVLRNRVVLSWSSIKGEVVIGLNPVSVSRLQPRQKTQE